jgi:hypothetical protein
MDPEKFLGPAFKKDSRIRYVAIIDGEYHLVASRMREGVQSFTTEEEDRKFFHMMPSIIVDAVERLEPLLGQVDNVTVRYEKVLLVFFRVQLVTVVLSFNPDVSTPFISSLSEEMRSISYLLT